jgi:hypothetical protein
VPTLECDWVKGDKRCEERIEWMQGAPKPEGWSESLPPSGPRKFSVPGTRKKPRTYGVPSMTLASKSD